MPDQQLPPGWTKHLAPSGHFFYYHAASNKSTYDPPVEPPAPTAAAPAPQVPPKRQKTRRRPPRPDRPRVAVDLAPRAAAAAPWRLVFARSGRRFFHNPDSGRSRWTAPSVEVQDAVDAIDTDELLTLVAQARGLSLDEGYEEEDEKEEEVKEEVKEEGKDGVVGALQGRQFEIVDKDDEDDESEDEEEESEEDEEEAVSDTSSPGQDLGWIYDGNDEEEDVGEVATNPADLEAFFAMLDEYKINPYGTWDTEYPKVVDDERYDLIDTMKSRREAFAEWSRNEFKRRSAQQQEEEANTAVTDPLPAEPAPAAASPRGLTTISKDPAVQFLLFVRTKFSKKKYPYYIDFKRKFRAAPEFVKAAARLADKDREDLYRQYALVAKKPAAERVVAFRDALAKHALASIAQLPAPLLKDPRFHVLADEQQLEEAERYVREL